MSIYFLYKYICPYATDLPRAATHGRARRRAVAAGGGLMPGPGDPAASAALSARQGQQPAAALAPRHHTSRSHGAPPSADPRTGPDKNYTESIMNGGGGLGGGGCCLRLTIFLAFE